MVDDHQIVIDGLLSLLKGHPRFQIAFATTQPEKVLQLLESSEVQILITDIMMPSLPGNVLARKVKEKFAGVRILALSMSGQGEIINEMIEYSDIAGYVLKNVGRQELISALEKIAAGGIYFSDEVLEELRRTDNRKKQQQQVNLTDREKEIIALIEKEYSNKMIAEKLFISERTVETHRKNIFRKTGTNSVIGLIKYAYEQKII